MNDNLIILASSHFIKVLIINLFSHLFMYVSIIKDIDNMN